MVKVHAMADPAAVAAASSVTVPALRFGVAVPPVPNPEQLIAARAYPAGMLSVTVVAVLAAVRVWVAPETPVPEVTVVMDCEVQPLVPVKVKAPTPPFDTLVRATVGSRVLVSRQVMSAPAITFTAGTVTTLPEIVPKLAGLPVVAALASTQVAAVRA